jgi:hypothetical protein
LADNRSKPDPEMTDEAKLKENRPISTSTLYFFVEG